MPTEFYFAIRLLNIYSHTSSQSQKHSAVTSQTQVSVIGVRISNNPLSPFNSSFNLQHSSQIECSPADVGSSERTPYRDVQNLKICRNDAMLFCVHLNNVILNFTEF